MFTVVSILIHLMTSLMTTLKNSVFGAELSDNKLNELRVDANKSEHIIVTRITANANVINVIVIMTMATTKTMV